MKGPLMAFALCCAYSAAGQVRLSEVLARAQGYDAGLEAAKEKTAAAAWAKLVSPQDRVAIKISTAGGSVLSTHKGLLSAVIKGLTDAGVPAQNIVIWDKFKHHLEKAGFDKTFGNAGIAVTATVPEAGYDPESSYEFEVTGQLIWGDRDFDSTLAARTPPDATVPDQLSTKSYFSNIVTRQTTKIINIPALTDHPEFGLNGCLVSLAVDSADNCRRFGRTPYYGVPAIPEIWNLPFCKDKCVLNILDGLVIGYAGGPAFNANYAEPVGKILASLEPVAPDALALAELKTRRESAHVATPEWFGVHVDACAQSGLGEAQREKMDIVELEI